MADELLRDLPRDLPTVLERFGTDARAGPIWCGRVGRRAFAAAAAATAQAYSHKKRLIEECTACGKQHSILAGTIFEQTKTGLARWFLAIYLVTSSKGGISAMELQRQMGFGSYGTAWAWLHKIRRAMVVPGREPLRDRVEADETLVGGAQARQARPRRCGQDGGRRRGREPARQGARPPARPAAAAGGARRLGREPRRLSRPNVRARPPWSPPTAGRAIAGSGRGLRPRADPSRPVLGRRRAAPAGHPPRLRPRQALAPGHPPWCGQRQAPARPISTSTSSASTAAPPRASPTASPASSSRPSSPNRPPTAPSATAAA